MKRLKANLISVNVGKVKALTGQNETVESAIEKTSVDGSLYLSSTQLEGDEQADLKNHGGKDKAVCVYPFDHYLFWEENLNEKLSPGAFGENLTVKGLTEDAVYIGDVFQWGKAQVQVSQPRIPCHKLAKKLNHPKIPQTVTEQGLTGFYMRVLKEGTVSVSQPLQFIKRYSEVSVAYVNEIYFHDQKNEEAIKQIIAVPELALSCKTALEKRLQKINETI
ncbi:MOSC domain-containing protein [Bacillus shivajii]|uniref:MOSC domain-containing protein n=1 Tax=Bacillus shivajii TaxID=1983719 RepID=UPI001CFA9876|nr:MOSC domain-containing protein [Bacillus shivajii]UCZ54020.1 MOSC domain-containing protein [Bacillus shivajii]